MLDDNLHWALPVFVTAAHFLCQGKVQSYNSFECDAAFALFVYVSVASFSTGVVWGASEMGNASSGSAGCIDL